MSEHRLTKGHLRWSSAITTESKALFVASGMATYKVSKQVNKEDWLTLSERWVSQSGSTFEDLASQPCSSSLVHFAG